MASTKNRRMTAVSENAYDYIRTVLLTSVPSASSNTRNWHILTAVLPTGAHSSKTANKHQSRI